MIEAMKLAFADVYAHVADARHMQVPPEQMLQADYLASRARLIDPNIAQAYGTGHSPQGGTVYLTAADRSGMMVSFIQSNYMGFGSGVVVPGTGVSLQNRGYCFGLDPEHPNVVAGGKRPFHTIIPGFLMRDGSSGVWATRPWTVMSAPATAGATGWPPGLPRYCGNVAVENNRSPLHGIDRYQELRRGRGSKSHSSAWASWACPWPAIWRAPATSPSITARPPRRRPGHLNWRPPCRHAA